MRTQRYKNKDLINILKAEIKEKFVLYAQDKNCGGI